MDKWISCWGKEGRLPTYSECCKGIVVLWKDGRIGCVHYVPASDFWIYGDSPDYWLPLPKTKVEWHNTIL